MISAFLEEQFRKHSPLRIAKAFAIITVIVVIVLQLSNPPLYERITESTFDMLYNGSGARFTSKNDVIILGLDRKTFSESGLTFPQFFPQYAKIIKRLTRAKARAIAFDITVTTAPDEMLAADFIEAVEKAPPFIMATQLPPEAVTTPSMPETKATRAIIDSPKIKTGYVDLITSKNNGGTIRRMALVTNRRGKKYRSFALTILKEATAAEVVTVRSSVSDKGDILPITIESDEWNVPLSDGLYRIPFLGSEGGIPYISCADLLAEDRLPDVIFKDKIVIFGPTEEWFHDFHQTPVGITAGVQIHGNIVRAILANENLTPLSTLLNLDLIIAVALISFIGASRLKAKKGLPVLVIFIFILLWLVTWCGISGTWISPFPLVLVSLICFFLPLIIETIHEALEAARIQKLFGQFVSKEVFQAIMESKDGINLAGSEMEATILFSDIRGFTTMSEKEGAEATFSILSNYLAEMVQVIFKNGGRLDKFIGDAIMAVYGAPFKSSHDPLKAVKTAWEMKERLGSLNKNMAAKGCPELKIGIGLCTGKLYAGVLGTSEKMEYAVIGDTVNTASRLEHMTKDEGVTILMSGSTYEKVKDHVEVMELGDRDVRGKNEKLKVYALMDLKKQPL
jgi:adenylate cyclase